VDTSIETWASRLAGLHAISMSVSEAIAYRLKTHLSLSNTAELNTIIPLFQTRKV